MLEFGLFRLEMIAVFVISFAIGYNLFRYKPGNLFSLLVPTAIIILMIARLWLMHELTFTRAFMGAVCVFILFVWGDDCAYKKDAKANQAKLDAKNTEKAELLKSNGKTWN